MVKEEWRPIAGYEHLYEVSNRGRVRSIDRYIKNSRGYTRLIKGRTITPTGNGNGYKLVGLSVCGHKKNFYVHRLVAKAFVTNPDNKPEVNHKNYKRDDNFAENLEWCTDKENTKYSVRNMRHPRNVKTGTFGKGIRLRNHKYEVGVYHSGKQYYLGRFENLTDAIAVRNQWYEKMGVTKWLNQ